MGAIFGQSSVVFDPEIVGIAATSSAANKAIYFTAPGTAALFDITAAGRELLNDANVAAMRTTLELGTAATQAATAFQAADAELTAIAGLTSAADKGVYFTGSGTADLFSLTAFARTLLDDADAATARGTLVVPGLGVEAGAVDNTFFSSFMLIRYVNDGASGGPSLILDRQSASAANADALGRVTFRGRNNNATPETINYGFVGYDIQNKVDGAEAGIFVVWAMQAGTNALRASIGAGLYMAGATSGDMGAGTINATAVYDDGVQLMPKDGSVAMTGQLKLAKYATGSLPAGVEGGIAYDDTLDLVKYYNGTAWKTIKQDETPLALSIVTGEVAVNAADNLKRATLELTEDATLLVPTNGTDFQLLVVRVRQDGTGGWTLTMGDGFRYGAEIPSVAVNEDPNGVTYITLGYDATDDAWDVVAVVKGYVPAGSSSGA